MKKRRTNSQNRSKTRSKGQPRKDSREKRVNYDNTREDKFERDTGTTDKSNDVSWYAHNPELLRAAASIPFSTTVGLDLPFAHYTQDTTTSNTAFIHNYGAVPGVMSLDWVPAIGGRFTDAATQAANDIYSFTVHANSRNTKYDAPDLMMVILAGAQVFASIGKGIRAYGTMKLFDQRNSYLPEGLIRAMGFNYHDLQKNLSKMWFDINELIARSSQIWIPRNLPLIERWFWLNSNVYMDAGNVKSQYYVHNMIRYGIFEDGTGSEEPANGSSVMLRVWEDSTPKNATAQGSTWEDYMNDMNKMFDALLLSQDRGIMFGDLLKAYGQDNIYALNPIPADYVVQPVYNQEVLTQIENATVVDYGTPGAVAFAQSKDGKVFTWINSYWSNKKSYSGSPEQAVLNFHQVEVPKPEQVMVATRLMSLGTTFINDNPLKTGSAYTGYPEVCGTEIVTRLRVWMRTIWDIQVAAIPNVSEAYTIPAGTYIPFEIHTHDKGVTGDTNWSMNEVLQNFDLWSAFDWAPWIYSTQRENNAYTAKDPKSPKILSAYGDWDNYTIIDKETLAKMHRSAIYSLFGVPTI